MSVIVAVKEQSRIYIGSDTLASNENGEIWYNIQKHWVSSMNDGIIIGVVGNLSVVNSVRYMFPFAPTTPSHENVFEWVQQLRKEFKEELDFKTLICGGGKIFIATGAGTVAEVLDYEAIGSGSDLAKGSMYTSEMNTNVLGSEERIKTAIMAACKYDAFVGGEIKISMI